MNGAVGRFHARRNFILQQGLQEPSAEDYLGQFSALMFQPKLVGMLIAVAVLLQDAPLFVAIGAVLWWSALLPRLNPFDAFYNATFARTVRGHRLLPAPPPRRFSQAMNGSFALAAGLLMLAGHFLLALLIQAFLLIAVTALVLGNFCLGSFVWHLLGGRREFAVRTLPWARPPAAE
jgi:hypothetical protein